MKNFDLTRFGRVLKLDFVEGYKSMLWGALCMTLLYLFFFWFAHNIAFHDNMQDPEAIKMARANTICEAVGAFSIIAMFIYFLIAAILCCRFDSYVLSLVNRLSRDDCYGRFL